MPMLLVQGLKSRSSKFAHIQVIERAERGLHLARVSRLRQMTYLRDFSASDPGCLRLIAHANNVKSTSILSEHFFSSFCFDDTERKRQHFASILLFDFEVLAQVDNATLRGYTTQLADLVDLIEAVVAAVSKLQVGVDIMSSRK